MKLKDIVMQYLENIKYSIKQKTYLFYLQMNDIYIVGFNKEILLNNLNEFLVSIKGKYSYSTTKLIKSLINRSLNFAFENGLIEEKIIITLHLKNQQIRKVQALEKQEQARLEKYILENEKSIIMVFF